MLVKEANTVADTPLTLIHTPEVTAEGPMTLPEERSERRSEEERPGWSAIVPQKERQEDAEKKLTRMSAMHSGREDARTKSLANERPG